jgi:hypothetical protein
VDRSVRRAERPAEVIEKRVEVEGAAEVAGMAEEEEAVEASGVVQEILEPVNLEALVDLEGQTFRN